MKVVKVEWFDICSGTPNWAHIDDAKESVDVMRCVSVGFVLKETDEIISIAQNYDEEDNLVSDTMTFPKAIVTKIVELN